MNPIVRATLLAVVMFVASAQAQDHLEPDDSVFTGYAHNRDYYANVAKVLGRVLPEGAPKVFVLPSNFYEYIVGIDDKGNRCSLVVGEVDHILWMYEGDMNDPDMREFLSDYPPNPLDVRVSVDSRSLDPTVCERIRAAWTAVLIQTRYPTPEDKVVGLDGVSFHFSAWQKGMGILAGQIWSPSKGSVTGKLVALTAAMRDYARAGRGDHGKVLESTLHDLGQAVGSAGRGDAP